MNRALSLWLVIGTLWLAGCSSGASAGEACKDGSECGDGLFCLIAAQGKPGACTAEPTGCGDAPKCSDTCYNAIKASCMNPVCGTINGRTTLSCQ